MVGVDVPGTVVGVREVVAVDVLAAVPVEVGTETVDVAVAGAVAVTVAPSVPVAVAGGPPVIVAVGVESVTAVGVGVSVGGSSLGKVTGPVDTSAERLPASSRTIRPM
jgi:hypothetical protein